MKLLIIDGNSIINRAFYGVKSRLTNSDGVPTNAVYGFLNLLLKTVRQYSPDYIACAFDRREPTFRHKMYDGYKATRKGMPEELAVQMPLLKELLASMNIKCFELAGYEADDIIGTASRICNEKEIECVILTGDKDDLQLASGYTKIALTVTKEHETVTELMGDKEILEKYGICPENFIDVKALMGDSSDNVPGVAGIGEKSAFELIKEYKTIENLYENTEKLSGSRKDKIINGKEMAFLSKTLVTIDRFVPIEFNFDEMNYTEPSGERFLSELKYLGFNSIIKKLGITAEASVSAVKKDAVTVIDVGAEKICEIFKESENALIILKDEKLLFSNEKEVFSVKIEEISSLKGFFEGKTKKTVFGLKPILRLLLKNEIEANNVCFDAETAAYLLNPSQTNYTLSNAIRELLKEDFDSDTDALTRLLALKTVMEEKLEKLEMTKLYYEIELPLTFVLASMEHIGFKADAEALSLYGEALSEEAERISAEIYEIAGEEFNINSPKQLGVILFEKLGLKSGKKTKSGYSTDAQTLEKLKSKHEIIAKILDYRSVTKLKSTYAEGLLKQIEADGRIHSTFLQTVTQTGRISSKEPNLQNIPVRKEIGRELRKMFIAEDGMTLVDGDYSQIELRVLADISKDAEMTDAFLNDEDIHTKTASEVFKIHPEFVTPLMRTRAKAVNFGIVYGMGEFSLSEDLKISIVEARNYIKNYLESYIGVKEYVERVVKEAKENGYVKTAFGRIRYIPELAAANKNIVNFGERVARNTPIQGTAADIIKIAMVRVYNRLKEEKLNARLILQIHDEMIVECASDEKEKVIEIMREEMEKSANLTVPLKADINSGKSWFNAK